MSPQFSSIRLTERVTRIYDRLDAQMYLIEGRDRALLVDTGFGVDDLRAFVGGLTDKALTVLITHAHLDHALGASWFDDVYLGHADLGLLEQHVAMAAEVHDESRAEGRVVADPPDLRRLQDIPPGMVFDLGGLTVRPLALPGHTPGTHIVLVEEERLLITGDAGNQRTFLFVPGASTVAEYRRSLAAAAAATVGRYDRIHISHSTGDAPITLFADLDALCERIEQRMDEQVPFEFRGMTALLARRVLDGVEDANANIAYDPARIR